MLPIMKYIILSNKIEEISDQYYYTDGVEDVEWVEGYTVALGSQSKEIDYLHLQTAYDIGSSFRTYVTNVAVNLTNINTLYIEWENAGNPENIGNCSYFIASSSKMDGVDVYDAILSKTLSFSKVTNSLDVSGLSGSYYIRVHAGDTVSSGITSLIKTYKVWGEA